MILACSPPALGAANALASRAFAFRGLFCGPDPGGLFEGRGLTEGVAADFGDFGFDAAGFGFNEGFPVFFESKINSSSNTLECPSGDSVHFQCNCKFPKVGEEHTGVTVALYGDGARNREMANRNN